MGRPKWAIFPHSFWVLHLYARGETRDKQNGLLLA
jgi:hypothetical protein